MLGHHSDITEHNPAQSMYNIRNLHILTVNNFELSEEYHLVYALTNTFSILIGDWFVNNTM